MIFAAALILLATGCGNNSTQGEGTGKSRLMEADTGTPVISFNTLDHNFGVITEGEKLAYVFSYTNTGTGNLIITSASTSCGCTVPAFSKKPLAPGQKGTMEVIFDSSGFNGFQTKTITVQSNASVPVIVLAVRAEVKSKTK